MDIDSKLIEHIVFSGKIAPVIDSGLRVEDVQGDSGKVLAFIFDYYSNPKYQGQVPSSEIIQRECRRRKIDFSPPTKAPREQLAWVLDEIHKRTVHTLLKGTLAQAAESLDALDIEGAEKIILNATQALSERSGRTQPIDFASKKDREKRKLEYLQRKQNINVYGIPTGMKWLDDLTLGWQPGDFGVMMAKRGTAKTFWTLLTARAARLSGKVPMIVAPEMTTRTLGMRFDAINAQVSYKRLKRGQLTPEEEKRYFKSLKELDGTPYHVPEFGGKCSPMTIIAKARELKADLVLFDGWNFIDDDGGKDGWAGLYNAARDIKRWLKSEGKIFVTTAQMKSDEPPEYATLDNLAYGTQLGEFAAVGLKAVRGEDQRLQKSMLMYALKLREEELPDAPFEIPWDLDEMILGEKEEEEDAVTY